MKSLKNFINNFFSNKGQYVFISLLIAKICGFISSVVVVRLLSQNDYGIVTIVASIFAVFATFNGLGSSQGLLRFGSLEMEVNEKEKLSGYFLYQGFVYQIILSLVFFVLSILFIHKYEDILRVFIFFSIRLIGFYFFAHIQAYFRMCHNNKSFSSVNNFVNISGVLLIIVLSYYFGLTGYLLALAISPFFSLYWFFKLRLFRIKRINLEIKDLWSYSIHAVITAFFSDFLFSLDILLLGFLLTEKEVANYKVAIILPSNLTFLAVSMLQADFPKIARNSQDKLYLKNYIENYYKIFIPICLSIFFVGYVFSTQILSVFFGKIYSKEAHIFLILLFAFLMNVLFRNLYGNLLSAVGLIKFNTLISFASLFILLIGAFVLVPKYNILGMGISLASAMIFSGIMALLCFVKYLKEI